MEVLLGSAGVGSCPGISKWCKLGLVYQQSGSYAPTTELELIRFLRFPFGEIMWHLRTQVNDSLLAYYITVFELSRGNIRRFIPFLVYALVYMSIASNLLTFATLSPCSGSVVTHTCSPFLRKPLLR